MQTVKAEGAVKTRKMKTEEEEKEAREAELNSMQVVSQSRWASSVKVSN
jgi:hypothetical protein